MTRRRLPRTGESLQMSCSKLGYKKTIPINGGHHSICTVEKSGTPERIAAPCARCNGKDKKMIKVAAIYTAKALMGPLQEMFDKELPEAKLINVCDDSLIFEVIDNNGVTPP